MTYNCTHCKYFNRVYWISMGAGDSMRCNNPNQDRDYDSLDIHSCNNFIINKEEMKKISFEDKLRKIESQI